MHRLRLSPLVTSNTILACGPLARARRPPTTPSPDAPGCICHQRGPRLPESSHSHDVALLNHLRASPFSPPLLVVVPSVSFLALLKERYKNNETTKETHPLPLTLSLALWGHRWVLASLSTPALVSTSVPPPPLALAQQTTSTRRRNRGT